MKRSIIFGFAAAALIAGCAKLEKNTDNQQTREYIEAWMKLNHPEADPTPVGRGIYILSETPGSGEAWVKDSIYVHIDYTTYNMQGTIMASTDKKICQQVGSYDKTSHYGPKIQNVETLPVGVEEMLKRMRDGGELTALVPSYLMTTKRYKKDSDYMAKKADGSSTIYRIKLHEHFLNEVKWEVDSVNRHMARVHPGIDTTSFGFWRVMLREPECTTAFRSDTTVYVNYTGRLLNGLVFDTTIADTAKKYNIFNPDKKYGPWSIKWASEQDDLTFTPYGSTETTSSITGFKKAIWEMRSMEKSSAIFISWYGYTSGGQGNAIPGFSPLQFDLEMVSKPE